jgi:CRP-like cAMP-binding protein
MDIVRLFKSGDEDRTFAAGEVIFSKGEPAHQMYVVLQGEVDVQRDGRHLVSLGAGSLLGEMALVGDHIRSASAVAKTACRLAIVSERRFVFLVQETPFFALHVMRTMADRLRRADELLAKA